MFRDEEETRTMGTESEFVINGKISRTVFDPSSDVSVEVKIGSRGHFGHLQFKFHTEEVNPKWKPEEEQEWRPKPVKLDDLMVTHDTITTDTTIVKPRTFDAHFSEEQLVQLHAWIGTLIKK